MHALACQLILYWSTAKMQHVPQVLALAFEAAKVPGICHSVPLISNNSSCSQMLDKYKRTDEQGTACFFP